MKKLILSVIMILLLFIVSCDHTDLSGEIVVIQSNTVDNNMLLMLEVPDDLSEIHGVMWTVWKTSGEESIMINDLMVIEDNLLEYFTEDDLKQLIKSDTLNLNRLALFTPTSSGKYIIEVDGFYLQTNPQPITQIEIEIN